MPWNKVIDSLPEATPKSLDSAVNESGNVLVFGFGIKDIGFYCHDQARWYDKEGNYNGRLKR